MTNASGPASIALSGGTHAINTPVALTGGLLVATSGGNPWQLSFGTAGGISGTGPLKMDGPGGALILSGSDSFSGGTIVEAGRLDVTSAAALPRGQSLTVGAGGTFIFDPTAAAAPLAGGAVAASGAAVAAVPEPSSLLLLAAGVLASGMAWRRKRARTAAD